MDQTTRRVIHGEVIPHEEKVFSIFEPHTEWISKGKAGVPVELGVKVCILEDQHQFILHHRVMEKETDEQVCIPMVVEAKKRFPKLNACSFDKGFHSPANQVRIEGSDRTSDVAQKRQAIAQESEAEQSEAIHQSQTCALGSGICHQRARGAWA